MTSSKLIAPEEGGLVPVSLRRGLTIRGMTKAGRDWIESNSNLTLLHSGLSDYICESCQDYEETGKHWLLH